MKKLFIVLSVFIASSLLLSSCSKDDDNPKDDEKNINVLDKITDPAFKECLQTFIEKGMIKTSSPDTLTAQEAAAVEVLNIYRWKIKNLEGIEYFTGLKELDCSHNPEITFDLSKNTKLEKLRSNYCSLTSLDVSNNKELQSLQCWNNSIKLLDVSNCTKLTVLECNENELTKLDVSMIKGLRYLDCCDNNITGTLDVSSCNLRVLRTSHNPIAALKLNATLENLTCVMNDLSELDLSKCAGLLNIMCTRNPKMASLDITNNRNLKSVDCGGISTEPAITLYVWWDVPADNMWGNRPSSIDVGVGANGKLVTKR